jgi:hypothetical protein
MPLPCYRIVYVGCALAGKLYSVHSMLARARQPIPDPISALRESPHLFTARRAGEPFAQISLSISDKRATNIDYVPSSPFCDRGVRREIDHIAQAHGLIFVIDSQRGREDANLGTFARLRRDLAEADVDLAVMPVVFQANKRDLAEIVTMEWVTNTFRVETCAYVESAAMKNVGTLEAMRELLALVETKGPH